jgi:two-component system cell cycle response regulator DivK
MDLTMPGLDGLEVTRRLREDPANAGVKIIALTAHAMRGDEERALAGGCDAVLTKPYSPKDLVRLVRQLLAVDGAGSRP